MRAHLAGVVALALAAGCGASGGGGDDDDVGPDADPTAPDADPTAPDASPCGALDVEPAWLTPALSDAISRLSGASEIVPGTTLPDRATAPRRGIARDWIADQLDALGLAPQLHAYGSGTNVWARLPGSDPSAGWIVLGAHYDSVAGSPGANDNASGVAAVLASARLLRDTCRRAGVIVALFDQEEIGLVGSEAFADLLVDTAEDVVAVHTIDQLAWDEDGDRVYEIELPTQTIWSQYQAAAGALGFDVSETTVTTTDHQAFRERGFPAAGVTEEYFGGDTTDCYHLPCDVFADVDLAYTTDGVSLITRVIHTAAQ